MLAGALAWAFRDRLTQIAAFRDGAPAAVSAGRVDPADEGRRVRVAGKLHFAHGARDPQLGIAANAAILFRDVAIFQWHEHCEGGACRYDMAWSSAPVDSRRFREPAGHENPPAPFASARFDAPGLQVGAYAVDADLLAAQLRTEPLAVSTQALPPNLAAVFHDGAGGVLFAGDDAAHPRLGAIRISYRIVAPGEVALSGVQRGDRLTTR